MLGRFFSFKDSKNENSKQNCSKKNEIEKDLPTIMGAADMGSCGYNPQRMFERSPQPKKDQGSTSSEQEIVDLVKNTLNPFI
jgi:hypothetical protein